MHSVKESKCLITFLREVKIYKNTAVILSLQLVLCNLHKSVCILKRIHQVIIQSHISLFHLIIEEHYHVNERYAVV